MREILFRGKSIDDGKWVEGYLLKIPSPIQWGYSSPWFIDVPPQDPDGAYARFNVDEKTVGQYTGLTDKTDKNGKKIFEGDIVRREYTLHHGETKTTRETQIGVVVYSNRDCGFQVEKKCNLRKPWDGDTIEVIGNIHDNPELLKGE